MLDASLGGAKFWVEEVDDEPQYERTIIHERFGGKSWVENAGPSTPRFTITAHLIGSNYEADLAALEAVLARKGPYKLVHPHRGERQVKLDGPPHVRRSTREGGMARVTIALVEAGTQPTPRVKLDTAANLKAKSALAKAKMLPPNVDVSGPDFLTTAARAILSGPGSVTAELSRVNNRINAAFGLIDDMSTAIDDFSSEVTTLLLTPATLGLKLQNLINSVMTAVSANAGGITRGDQARNLARVAGLMQHTKALGKFGDNLSVVVGSSSAREQQRDNQNALVALTEVSALASGLEAVVDIPLDNTAQADSILDTALDIFDSIEARGGIDDGAGQALADLRAAFHAHLRSVSEDLTALGKYTPRITMPAICIAHTLYRDATRDEELIERNRIRHPLFVTGGSELTVPNV